LLILEMLRRGAITVGLSVEDEAERLQALERTYQNLTIGSSRAVSARLSARELT